MRRISCILLYLLIASSFFTVGALIPESAQAHEAPTFSTFAPKANYTRIPQSTKATTTTQNCSCKSAAKADCVFLIDVTGSMNWCIESVKTNLQAFSESLIAQGVDARFAVIEFSDAIHYPGSTKIYQLEGNSWWTSDIPLLEAGLDNAINACYSNPGWSETQNDACYELLNTLISTFRTDAARFAFLLTDEGNNVVASDSRLKDMSTYAAMLKNRNIRTSVISLESLRNEFQVLSDVTEGMYLDLRSSDYYKTMLDIADYIADVTGLTVHVMERARVTDRTGSNGSSINTPNLICDARDSSGYNDGNGSRITEKTLANITTPENYVKSGYTADGNTRLIIRVQHNRPGKVYFDVGSEFGTLEDLNRKTITASTAIETTEIQNGKLYQSSAVLVAPEKFPLNSTGNDGFPKREFELKVKFVCGCGESGCNCDDETQTKKLEIHATPVIFIHGIYGSFAGTFVDKKGVFRTLLNNNMDIGYWDYTNTEGPTNQIIDKVKNGEHSGLFRIIEATLTRMLATYNIACTRVDVICHSMGGLMARTFLEYEDKASVRSYRNSMIRRLITIATPHEGSPLTSYLLNGGNSLPYIIDPNTDKFNHPSGKKYGLIVDFLTNDKNLPLVRKFAREKIAKVDVDAWGAWTDLALNSELVQDLKSRGIPPVPTHVFYGTIASVVDKAVFISGELSDASDVLNSLGLVNPILNAFIQVGATVLENVEAFLEVIFNNEDYDTAVGESSAVSIFNSSYITHKDGKLDYHHNGICKQDDVAREVLSLLKGDLSKFDTSGVGKSSSSSSASSQSYSSMSANSLTHSNTNSIKQSLPADKNATDDYFLTKYSLTLTNNYGSEYTAPYTITAEGSTDVTFTLTAEDPAENNIYLSIGNEQGGFFLQMSSTDETLKNFTASMTLPSEYSGTMSVHAFSSPNSDDEDHVYISDTLNINIAPEIEYTDPIKELSFMGNSVIIAGTSYDIGLNLFAVTSEGRYVDVSAPSVASRLGIYTDFSDSTVATLTDDGKIRGLKHGSTSFTASYNSLSSSISVDVDMKYEMSAASEPTSRDLFITTASLQDGKAGLSYTQILESTLSFTDNVVWTVSGLPAGLVCGADGIISGKPITNGAYSVDITVSNDNETASKTLGLTISPADNPLAPIISTLSIPSGIVSREYTASISATASGDKSAMSWSLYSGSLPEGLNFDSYNGETITLSGIPQEAGNFTFMVQVYFNGYNDMQSFTLAISELEAPGITTATIPGGIEGSPYSYDVEATGTPPLTWSIIRGNLPDGLTLSADTGIISGIPLSSGDFVFTVSAMNDAGEASADFTIHIEPKFVAVSPDFTIDSLPSGTQGTPYSARITVSGTEPLEISLTGGALPEGLSFSGGLISGTPTASGQFTLTFTVSNIAGRVSKTFALSISPAQTPVKSDDKKSGGSTVSDDDGKTISDDSKQPVESGIVIGPERGISSLSPSELATVSNDNSMIAAVLPEVTANESGFFAFEGVRIDSKVPAGYVLEWHSFARLSGSEVRVSAESGDSYAVFLDENGEEISEVPEGRLIDVSAYFEAGNTYAPVISAFVSGDKSSSVPGGSGGGCGVAVSGVLLLAALGFFAVKVK